MSPTTVASPYADFYAAQDEAKALAQARADRTGEEFAVAFMHEWPVLMDRIGRTDPGRVARIEAQARARYEPAMAAARAAADPSLPRWRRREIARSGRRRGR